MPKFKNLREVGSFLEGLESETGDLDDGQRSASLEKTFEGLRLPKNSIPWDFEAFAAHAIELLALIQQARRSRQKHADAR